MKSRPGVFVVVVMNNRYIDLFMVVILWHLPLILTRNWILFLLGRGKCTDMLIFEKESSQNVSYIVSSQLGFSFSPEVLIEPGKQYYESLCWVFVAFILLILAFVYLFFKLNILGWLWLIKLYRFQVTVQQHIICILHCVFGTQS